MRFYYVKALIAIIANNIFWDYNVIVPVLKCRFDQPFWQFTLSVQRRNLSQM